MNPPSGPMRTDGSHLVRSTSASSRGHLDHSPVPFTARSAQFIFGEWSDYDARADCVDPCAALAPTNRRSHNAQGVPALRDLIRVKRIRYLVGLKERKIEQLLHRCCGQRFILFDGEWGEAMPGLRRDNDTCATAGDDIAELLQHECCAIKIDFEDRRR